MGERVSEIVHCDGCGQPARRRSDCPSPDHWFYLESVDRSSGNPQSKYRVYIVWACSEECRDGIWKKGPGPSAGAGSIDEEGTARWRKRMGKEAP